ncbi:hypothetical protein PFISCL1PPCAC_19098, partial [Pristionchus fissidentatus]
FRFSRQHILLSLIEFYFRMITLFVFLATTICSEAVVDFSYSTLYDIYDFVGQEEVHISRCDTGCVIFASTMGFPDGPGPKPPSLQVLNKNNGKSQRSIFLTVICNSFTTRTQRTFPVSLICPRS